MTSRTPGGERGGGGGGKASDEGGGVSKDIAYQLVENTTDVDQPDTGDRVVANGNYDDGKTVLKKELGLFGAVAVIVGSIIGSGIFIVPQGILMEVHSIGMSLMVWIICGVVASLGALCMAELASIVPKAGGVYTYIHLAYGELPAFLAVWASALVLKPSNALVALTFGFYAAEYLTPGNCPPPDSAVRLFALVVIFLVGFVNCISVKAANSLQIILTVSKVIVLVLIIAAGMFRLITDPVNSLHPKDFFKDTSTDVLGYALAFYQGFWAFGGWDVLNALSEEVVNSKRNIPLALCIAMPIITLIYLLVNIAYFAVLTTDEMLTSSAPAVTFAEHMFGPMAWIIPFGVCISTSGSLILSLLADTRILYAAAREGQMLSILSTITLKWNTPAPAVIFQCLLMSVLVLLGGVSSILKFVSCIVWVLLSATFVSIFILRRKLPNRPGHFKIPSVVPVVAALFAVYMVVAGVIAKPSLEFLYAALIMVLGVIYHTVVFRYKYQPRCMDSMTRFLQKLCLSGPSAYQPE